MAEQSEQDDREALRGAFGKYLGNEVYVCHRDWSAWGWGTMSLEDFSLAIESDDLVESLVNIAMTHAARRSPAPQQVSTVEELDALPDGAVLLSEHLNRKFGHRKLIQVAIAGEYFMVDGIFEFARDLGKFLPATVLYRPEGGESRG